MQKKSLFYAIFLLFFSIVFFKFVFNPSVASAQNCSDEIECTLDSQCPAGEHCDKSTVCADAVCGGCSVQLKRWKCAGPGGPNCPNYACTGNHQTCQDTFEDGTCGQVYPNGVPSNCSTTYSSGSPRCKCNECRNACNDGGLGQTTCNAISGCQWRDTCSYPTPTERPEPTNAPNCQNSTTTLKLGRKLPNVNCGNASITYQDSPLTVPLGTNSICVKVTNSRNLSSKVKDTTANTVIVDSLASGASTRYNISAFSNASTSHNIKAIYPAAGQYCKSTDTNTLIVSGGGSSSSSSGGSSSSSSGGSSSSSSGGSSSSSSGGGACACESDDQCTSTCSFEKRNDTNYPTRIQCKLSSSVHTSPPSGSQKNDWCNRSTRTKGDADNQESVTQIDYDYYVQTAVGWKVHPSINPDFNGDGEVGVADREIVVKTLLGN